MTSPTLVPPSSRSRMMGTRVPYAVVVSAMENAATPVWSRPSPSAGVSSSAAPNETAQQSAAWRPMAPVSSRRSSS